MSEIRPLTELEEAFVEAFVGECEFDPIGAYKAAGYQRDTFLYSAAMKVLDRPSVKSAIRTKIADATSWIDENAVIVRLWDEAMNANNASARINALVWVGKHYGMWQEKKQESEGSNINIQVLNYTKEDEEKIKYIESVPEVKQNRDKVSLPEGIQILSFEDKKN